jgi:hypothetical protein
MSWTFALCFFGIQSLYGSDDDGMIRQCLHLHGMGTFVWDRDEMEWR